MQSWLKAKSADIICYMLKSLAFCNKDMSKIQKTVERS